MTVTAATAPDTLTATDKLGLFTVTNDDSTYTFIYASSTIEASTSENQATTRGVSQQTSRQSVVSPSQTRKQTTRSTGDSMGPGSTHPPSAPAEPPSVSVTPPSATAEPFPPSLVQPSPIGFGPTISTPPIFSLGGTTYTALSSSTSIISEMTLNPGGSAITVARTALSLAADGSSVIASMVDNANSASAIRLLNPSFSPPYATLTNNIFPSPIPITAGQPLVIGGQTLSLGRPVIISGTTYSLAQDGGALAVGSNTINIPIPLTYTTITDAALPSPLKLIPGQPIAIAGTTLTPGVVETVSGTRFSLAPGNTALVAGSSTINLLTKAAYTTVTNAALPSPLKLTSGQPIAIAGTALTPGIVETISGTRYSLAPGDTALVVGSSTIDLPTQSAYTTITNAALPSPLQLTSGQPITIAGTSLNPGVAATISGTRYSLALGSTALVIGNSTLALTSSPTGNGDPGTKALNRAGAAGTGVANQGSQAAYTTNASYTGPAYQGKGTATFSSWSCIWIVWIAGLLAGLAAVGW
ncbi:MAG: hypothetical protein Q9160_002937 [Pyrenula sp. 1 TL-2023]